MTVKFKDIIGQERALKILVSQIESGKIPHAYLFSGPDGTGRRKTALEFAKALECESQAIKPCGVCGACGKISKGLHPDVHLMDFNWQAEFLEEDAEKQTQFKIDSVREIQREISLMPVEGRHRIFIVDPADKMNPEAANSFLKTLEEPPDNSVIILISSLREGLPKTVISRCQNVVFRALTVNEIARALCATRGGDAAGYERMARFAGGSVSAAIELLESFADDDGTGGVLQESKIWKALRENAPEAADIIEDNPQLFSGRAGMEKFLKMILVCAQADLEEESSPSRFSKITLAIEKIMSYRKALRYNVNPKLISAAMIYELGGIFSGERYAGSGKINHQ